MKHTHVERPASAGSATPVTPSSTPSTLWAYAYPVHPPRSEAGMVLIRALLDQESGEATRDPRTWSARLVVEPQVTHAP